MGASAPAWADYLIAGLGIAAFLAFFAALIYRAERSFSAAATAEKNDRLRG